MRIAAAVFALLGGGCQSGAFVCQTDHQCGAEGHCELAGYCSFPDGSCDSGRRFGQLAGGGFAGLCVDVEDGTSTGAPPATMPMTTAPPVTTTGATTVSVADTGIVATSTGPGPTTDTGQTSTGVDLESDLLLWMEFEDSLEKDSSEYDRVATCAPAQCPTLVAGIVGGAAAFDGVDDILYIPDDASLAPPQFTATVWLRVDDETVGSFATAYAKPFGVEHLNSFEFYYRASTAAIRFGTDAGTDGLTSTTLEPVWTHLAGVYDGATLSLYKDGELVDSVSRVDTPNYDANPITIGADINLESEANYWSGEIDDIRLYGRALDGDEIQALATAP